jgi:hypothetical protein
MVSLFERNFTILLPAFDISTKSLPAPACGRQGRQAKLPIAWRIEHRFFLLIFSYDFAMAFGIRFVKVRIKYLPFPLLSFVVE